MKPSSKQSVKFIKYAYTYVGVVITVIEVLGNLYKNDI